MSDTPGFIIVDDDPFNNTVSRMVIKNAVAAEDISTFTDPEKGLLYLQTDLFLQKLPAILLLDINMPVVDGWDFLERFESFNNKIKTHVHIYILSSSVDLRDKTKAEDNAHVKGFISKPLTRQTIISAAEKMTE